MARLTQGPEEMTAVIKCTGCGLTLEWETEIKVVISRSGKRTRIKKGMDPIEAWNQRSMGCDCCSYKIHSEQVSKLSNCNDCGVFDCEQRPRIGENARINCPLLRPIDTEK